MSKSVCICGTGSYVPEVVVTNDELEKNAPTKKEWVESVLGIRSRRRVKAGQSTGDMATKAALKAIQDAKMKPEEIDLIILGTITPDRLIPYTGAKIQKRLGAVNSVAFDINSACAGFLNGLIISSQFLQTGYFKNALVIGSDAMSMLTDYQDRTCVYYGDAAGAVVLKILESENGIKTMYFGSNGLSGESVTVSGIGSEYPLSEEVLKKRWQYLYMGGKEVYNSAIKIIPMCIQKAMTDAGITPEQLAYLVPHQPNLSLLRQCVEKVKIPVDKVAVTLDRFANASSANIPLALDELNRLGKLKNGDWLVLVTIGAGWTWGSVSLKWGV